LAGRLLGELNYNKSCLGRFNHRKTELESEKHTPNIVQYNETKRENICSIKSKKVGAQQYTS
jgi:hypothetical protein